MKFTLRQLFGAVTIIAFVLLLLLLATRDLRERMAIRSDLKSIGAYAVAFGPSNSISVAFHGPVDSPRIARYKRIEVLDFKEARITSDSLDNLAGLEHVRTVVLSLSDVGDEDLSRLRHIGSIHNLIVSHTALTDSSVDTIAKIPGLKVVDVTNTAITQEGVKRLRAARPRLDILDRGP